MNKGNPYSYEAGYTIENHRDELIERLGKAIKRINELETQKKSTNTGKPSKKN